MDFTEKLQKILNDKGITAYKLCKDIGIAPNSLNNWKKGSLPTIDKFEKIVLYLEIKPEELLNIEISEDYLLAEEKRILEAYRAADPIMKAGARKILDVKEESSRERLSSLETG